MKVTKKLYFTLIELLTVIAIIAILAGMILGGVAIAAKKAKEAAVQATCVEIKAAIGQYKTEIGDFPAGINSQVFTPSMVNTNARGITYYRSKSVKHPFGKSFTVYVDADFDGYVPDGTTDYLDDVLVVSEGASGNEIKSSTD